MGIQENRPNNLLKEARQSLGMSQKRVAEIIDTDTGNISRWECGHQKVSPYYQEKLCKLFQKNARELGFIDSPQKTEPLAFFPTSSDTRNAQNKDVQDTTSKHSQAIYWSIIAAIREIGVQDLDILRRRLLEEALDTLKVSSQFLFVVPALERLSKVVSSPLIADEPTLTYLNSLTNQYWQQRHSAVVTNLDLLSCVIEHLQKITTLLEGSMTPNMCMSLCSTASSTAQLIGHLLFDSGDYFNARGYHKTAIAAAQEANNTALEAVS